MTIETLVRAVPPPVAPVETFNGPWESIEVELGAALPQDYKDFVRLYGQGEFLEFLGVNVPWSWSPHVSLVRQVHVVCKVFVNDKDLPYPLWPGPDGLIPLGGTDLGDYLFWLARGPPENWRIVFWDRGLGRFERFDCSLTDFLAGIVTGAIKPEQFPDDLPYDRPFTPGPAAPDPNGPL